MPVVQSAVPATHAKQTFHHHHLSPPPPCTTNTFHHHHHLSPPPPPEHHHHHLSTTAQQATSKNWENQSVAICGFWCTSFAAVELDTIRPSQGCGLVLIFCSAMARTKQTARKSTHQPGRVGSYGPKVLIVRKTAPSISGVKPRRRARPGHHALR